MNSSQTNTILFQNVGSLHLWLHLRIDDVQTDCNIKKLTCHTVAMVTYCVMEMITCSPMISQFFDTKIVASSDKNNDSLKSKCWKPLATLIEPTFPTVLIGKFNIHLMQVNTEQKALKKYLLTDKGYTQLIDQYTTDYRTQIDHVPQIMCTISR